MKTLRTLLRLIFVFGKWALLSIFLGWATVISWFALISTSSYLISYAALQPSVAELQVAIVGVRFFGIARAVFRYLERLVSHTTTFKILTEMRVRFFVSLEKIAPAGILDLSSGDILARVIDDIETLQDFYIRVVYPPIVALLSSVAMLWFFGRWSLQIALAIFGFQLVVGVLLPLVIMQWSKKPARELVDNGAQIRGLSVDGIRGMEEIVAFGLQNHFLSRMHGFGRNRFKLQRRMHLIAGVQNGLTALFVNLSVLILLYLAVPLVNDGVLDGKLLAVMVLGGIASFEAVMMLPPAMQNFSAHLQAGKRLSVVFEFTSQVLDGTKDLSIDEDISLRVRELGFSYPGAAQSVLEDISFDLPIGKKIGVVGISGVGKTTLLNLLLRHWDFLEGSILLNGIDIREYSADAVREQIAVVNQNVYLFNDSVAENLRLGNPSANEDQIVAAAKAAGLHAFIAGMPKGYSTVVGEQGAFISGGEAQRLGLARALVRPASLYLLDEPFAHLDPISRAEIMMSTFEALAGRSVLFVTHQITGLAEMDEIILLDEGRIVERGRHADLIQKHGVYAEMWRTDQEFLLNIG